MKHSNTLLIVIIILATTVLMWAIPPFIKKATVSRTDYPFVYYSSRLKDLCLIDFGDKEYPMQDLSGKRYSSIEFDTLIPLLNYRQLMSDGLLPDSLEGVEISPRILMSKSVVWHFRPAVFSSPNLGLYGMLETMPLRGGLSVPKDLFRIENKMEFIDAETNSVNEEKSQIFADMLAKRGYEFPTKWAVGDANTRKSYDEGYFCLDNANRLFHIKMVNGRPYVRDTGASDSIEIAQYAIHNASDKRFYGFIFSTKGELYILEGRDGKYIPLKLDIPNIDITQDRVMIMGNIFYWTISITTPEGKTFYALRADNLKQIADYHVDRTDNMWDLAKQWLLPFYITMESDNSDYIYPRIKIGGSYSYIVSILLVILSFIITKKARLKERVFKILLVAVTGVMGLIAVLILPNFRK